MTPVERSERFYRRQQFVLGTLSVMALVLILGLYVTAFAVR
jgi:hypothetical protein